MSEQVTEVAQEETTQEQAQTTQLQLSDLLLCVQAIQLASTRGAFRAEEFTQIGNVFDRVTTFLKASGAIKSADTGESAEQTPAE